MIPEEYWYLVRKWISLIAGFTIVGGIAGFLLLPSVVGSGDGFNSTATLAVSQQASLAAVPTSGDVEVDDTVVASYTDALVTYAGSPQFYGAVRAAPLLEGFDLSTADLESFIKVTPNQTLFRVTVDVTADTAEIATAVTTAAVEQLKRHAIEEETQLATAIIANLDKRITDLAGRLPALQALKTTGTLEEQHLATAEAVAVNEELQTLFMQREDLHLGETFSLPLVTVKPPETVAVTGKSLSTRDVVLLGLLGGLLAGWGAANVAEGLTNKPKKSMVARPKVPPVVMMNGEPGFNNGWTDVREAHEVGVHFGRLAERAVQLERRVRALDSFRASTNGNHNAASGPKSN